jgi:pimeloyl-ACP methyl ester carboxylesterase
MADRSGATAREHFVSDDKAVMPTRTRRVDGLTVRYADSGPAGGPNILLTSPWPESLLAFRRVWSALSTRARLVAIDLPGFGHSEGRPGLFRPDSMGEFLRRLIGEFGLESPHVVAPDAGTAAALFLAARYPGTVNSLIVGDGAPAWPSEVTCADSAVIAATDVSAFENIDIRATVGAIVEPVASRNDEPEVWADYVTSYENGRLAESARYVRGYPAQLRLLESLLPEVRAPVCIVTSAWNAFAPTDGRYLAGLLPNRRLMSVRSGNFAWELDSEEYARIIAEWTRSLNAPATEMPVFTAPGA